MDNLEILQLTT